MLCPCGSGREESLCCAPYLMGKKKPPTPEALMRSRYVAFTRSDIAYIKHTMRGKALAAFHQEREGSLGGIRWIDLKIVATSTEKEQGTVTFEATFSIEGKLRKQKEKSVFKKVGGVWYYTDALFVEVVDL